MASDAAFERLLNIFKCGLCSRLTEKPISIGCDHIFCNECLYGNDISNLLLKNCNVCDFNAESTSINERDDLSIIFNLLKTMHTELMTSSCKKFKRKINWEESPPKKILKTDYITTKKTSPKVKKINNGTVTEKELCFSDGSTNEKYISWLKSVVRVIDHSNDKDITSKFLDMLADPTTKFPITLQTVSNAEENNENSNVITTIVTDDLIKKQPPKFIKCTPRPPPSCLPMPEAMIDTNHNGDSIKTSTPMVPSRSVNHSNDPSHLSSLATISEGVNMSIPILDNSISQKTPTYVYYIVKSRMSKKIYKQVLLFCEKFNVKYKEDIDDWVTHVVMHTDANKMVFRTGYTFKYLMGLASKKMLTSHLWIIESLASNKLLDPNDFEIVTDGVQVDRYVPKISRLSKEHLFQNYGIVLFGSFEGCYLSYENVTLLLSQCGAYVENLLEMVPLLLEKYPKVYVLCNSELVAHEKNDAIGTCEKYNVPLLAFDWAIESIVCYKVEPLDNYKIIM